MKPYTLYAKMNFEFNDLTPEQREIAIKEIEKEIDALFGYTSFTVQFRSFGFEFLDERPPL